MDPFFSLFFFLWFYHLYYDSVFCLVCSFCHICHFCHLCHFRHFRVGIPSFRVSSFGWSRDSTGAAAISPARLERVDIHLCYFCLVAVFRSLQRGGTEMKAGAQSRRHLNVTASHAAFGATAYKADPATKMRLHLTSFTKQIKFAQGVGDPDSTRLSCPIPFHFFLFFLGFFLP